MPIHRFAPAAFLAAAILASAGRPAWAHNELRTSTPADGAPGRAPREIVAHLRRSASTRRYTQIVVTDADREPMPTRRADGLRDLRHRSTLTATWPTAATPPPTGSCRRTATRCRARSASPSATRPPHRVAGRRVRRRPSDVRPADRAVVVGRRSWSRLVVGAAAAALPARARR